MWGHGNIFNGELNEQSAAYICGYVVKKMTGVDDRRLEVGQAPEFATMSNRPGIGAGFMDEVASSLLYAHDDIEDVPLVLRHGKKMRPLGRYLRQQLRKKMGRDKAVPVSVIERLGDEMRPMREFAFFNSRSLQGVVTEVYAPQTARLEFLEEFNRKGKKL